MVQFKLIASRLNRQLVLYLGSFRISTLDKKEHFILETSLTISKILIFVGPEESPMSRALYKSQSLVFFDYCIIISTIFNLIVLDRKAL